MSDDILKVGIADLKVAKRETGIITYALGSCIGICLLDPLPKIAGMVHIMLPETNAGRIDNIAKYATTGIPALIKQMAAAGANPARMKAKIAGGAQMFKMTQGSAIGEIGKRNQQKVKEVLAAFNIPIIAEDCGANYARTLVFYRESGIAEVRSYDRGVKRI